MTREWATSQRPSIGLWYCTRPVVRAWRVRAASAGDGAADRALDLPETIEWTGNPAVRTQRWLRSSARLAAGENVFEGRPCRRHPIPCRHLHQRPRLGLEAIH